MVGDGAGRGQTSGPKLQGGREYSGALHKAKLALASEEAGLVRAPALFANGLNRLAGDLRLHARHLHCHLCTSRHLQCQPAEAAGHDNIQRGRRILHGRCRRAIRVQQQGKARARPEGRWCARGPVEQQRFDVDGPVSARSVRDRAESSERSSREAGGAAPQQVGAPSSQRQHACGQRCKKRNLPASANGTRNGAPKHLSLEKVHARVFVQDAERSRWRFRSTGVHSFADLGFDDDLGFM